MLLARRADPFPGQGEDPLPVVLVHDRDGAAYRETARLVAGRVGTTALPFLVSIDPGAMLA